MLLQPVLPSCLLLFFTGLAACCSDCSYPSLIEATGEELQKGLEDGCFTSVDLVNAYTARIHEVNSTLHMVLDINPDALEVAKSLDLERGNGKLRGPLHGLPVMIKQTIGTDDKMRTAAGSYALNNAQVSEDATVAALLREQGLIILGKTSLSEWANSRSSNSTNGWNAEGGQTYAAYYPDQDPNGSSSGSAVSSDLGLAFATLGTETSGSLLLPGSVNNVVAIKPTVGLTSRYMVIPVSEHLDTIGPMARTVRDAASLLQVIAAQDLRDNYTLASPFADGFPDYVAACKNASGLQGKRIGIPHNVLDYWSSSSQYTPAIAAFEQAVIEIAAAGATIIDSANFTAYTEYVTSSVPEAVISADFITDLATYLSQLKTNPNELYSLADVRDFTRQFPAEEYPLRNTALWDAALAQGFNNTSPQWWPLYQEMLAMGIEGGVPGALDRDNLDAVILPTAFAPDMPALAGTPAITVPLGAMPDGTPVVVTEGMVEAAPGVPFGISFLGRKWSEEMLIGMAYAFEQRTQARKTLGRYIEPTTEIVDTL
ncbi:hypothetical protein ASPZODRAFT_21316 [Penicilliopsis zonata CBS 506.65]|uniref:Amidase domain-containing protein n=1 Tax=Penicilliopsis zonata CBS 506.65 TaxID=1073090 RepID=A0A1L9SUN9_9EURO|nr:hypothetical protein ASPZODRAFT_21316 [Penicilliopsis zonata CBS 506.65]OJJ50797.1 hypothetical protein ASPZODRAFT_21316 [Penicilliopsis zonata CBS 506.65]